MTIAIARRWFTPSGAVVAELAPGVDAPTVFAAVARLPHALYLDSAVADPAERSTGDDAAAPPRLGRYSFLAADPIHSVHVPSGDGDTAPLVAEAFRGLRSLLADLHCATIPGLPPFQGGVAGLLAYECGLARLGLRPPAARLTDAPLMALHVYDVVFAFDHDTDRGWIISQGVPARGPAARRARATERLDAVMRLCAEQPPASVTRAAGDAAPLPDASLPHSLPGHPRIFSTHTRESYLRMVAAGIEFVRAGDIFQVNLAQQMATAVRIDPVELYRVARRLNPAPFAGYLDAGPVAIASMSPERFLRVERGVVRMHPIKGTRRMIASPEADLYAAEDLGSSAKDRAENVMIVDLVRNDLSRVCLPETVRVESLCRLERYRYVQHLVSIVAGRLRPGLHALDAVDAAIPGGSVTGAPKHRACEIISELEGVSRGPYCGSLGYVGFDGTADFNLLIRTFVCTPQTVAFAVGGGITTRSDPAAEYDETLHKAEGMLRVLDAVAPAPARAAPAEATR